MGAVESGTLEHWDIGKRFGPWKEHTNGHLRDHIEAQFDWCDLSTMRLCMKNTLIPFKQIEVRDIIRAVFYNHSFQLIAVHGFDNHEERIFLIRIHPPVRFSPHGSPLLLLSVIDYQRLEELIEAGRSSRLPDRLSSGHQRAHLEGGLHHRGINK